MKRWAAKLTGVAASSMGYALGAINVRHAGRRRAKRILRSPLLRFPALKTVATLSAKVTIASATRAGCEKNAANPTAKATFRMMVSAVPAQSGAVPAQSGAIPFSRSSLRAF